MKKTIGFLTLGLFVGFVAASAAAQDAGRNFVGGIFSHVGHEEFEMSVGVNSSYRPMRAKTIRQSREQVNVPSHYGNLAAVTGDAEVALLWYRDDSGVIRNVVVDRPAAVAYRFKSIAIDQLEVDEP